MADGSSRAIRGRALTFVRTPLAPGDAESYRYFQDGIIVGTDGRIELVGRRMSWRQGCRRGLRSIAMKMH